MNLLHRISNSIKAFRYDLDDLDELMDQTLSGRPSHSGVEISDNTAMNFSAVFNAVQIIAGSIASLPLFLYRRLDENNKERMPDHPLYDILHNQPNPEMTSFVFREVLQNHLLLWGNAYAIIMRDKAGRTAELWPCHPGKVEIKRDTPTRLHYEIDEGKTKKRIVKIENMLHIPGLGFDGRLGYSVLTKARETLGLGLAMEEFQSRFYGQGTNVGGVVEHPGKLSDEAHIRLKKDIEDKHAGLSKAHKILLLEEGMKYSKTAMPLEDAQFLESRVFQIGEIARWFNLPPHKLKELSKATFSNIEQQQIEFVQDTIRPWVVRWEQHIIWKLLSKVERKVLFAEFLIDGLLRGDTESRMKAYAVMRQNGAMNADEWRRKENMNPIGGKAGETYWMPLNMMDAGAEPLEPKNKEEIEEKQLPNFELRALRSLKARRRTAEAYKEVFRSVEKDILSREVPAIKKIANKTLKTRSTASFIDEINKFYNGDFREFVRKRFGGLFGQYGEAIYPLAAEEIGADADLTDEYRAWVAEYTDHSTNRYIESSRGQMKQVALKHRENDTVAAIEQRLEEWEEKRPDKIANLEVVNCECATAQFVYYAGNFRTVWVTFDASCPYCESLNGMVISRGQSFIPAGTALQPEGVETPLLVTQNISHPAAHQNCNCSVRAIL